MQTFRSQIPTVTGFHTLMSSHHPTPSLPPKFSTVFRDVYEPAEDSFLLLDALEKDREMIEELRPLICVEVGSGSGVVLTFLATLLKTPAFYLATDINILACQCTQQTMEQNAVTRSDTVAMDLLSSLKMRLLGKVDVLLFNPPYVSTPSEEVGSRSIEAAWAGGDRGREVTDRLLPEVGELLSATGLFYVVVLPHNKPDEICSLLQSQGLKYKVVLQRRAQNENLSVYRFYNNNNWEDPEQAPP